MLSTSLSKIWQFSENLKKDGWIYEVIQDLKLHKITDKFSLILQCKFIFWSSEVIIVSFGYMCGIHCDKKAYI